MFRKLSILTAILVICSLSVEGADFKLMAWKKPLNIYCGDNEAQVVRTAIEILSGDLVNVCGTQPVSSYGTGDMVMVVGTLGKNPVVDKFVRDNNIDVSDIAGQWEAFKIMHVQNGSATNLLVVGSNDRGTAYGILELSRMIGVSPWEWWADAVPEKKWYLNIPSGFVKTDKPSVEYRGIFLNDEDWGLVPWSTKTFEPTEKKGEVGPKTYSKIFELLLRLRANTIWPAMHEVTVPFFMVEGTREAAEKYGITIGNSHCEPMLRTNTGEWNVQKNGRFNFLTNRQAVLDYWDERMQEAKNLSSFITIGMRGVHDGKMEGVSTVQEYTDALTDVIAEQRKLIAENLNPDVSKVPQAFIPYKEVLEVYDNGIVVPDDVTLIWCDDNYGYLTRLSNPEEQKRAGGAGVYYHISYWGRPHDYLWLTSTSPSQIYSEMKKAWDYGARKIWILNVGDIKPAEYDIEFFMDLAWDINMVNESNIHSHLDKWMVREFGKKMGPQLAEIMKEYYHLATFRKPEHMGWNQVEVSGVPGGRTPVTDTDYNPFIFGDEMQDRLESYYQLRLKADKLRGKMPQNKIVPFFQLVYYPVVASGYMNEKLLYAQKARLMAKHGLPVANAYSYSSDLAYRNIESFTRYYNETLNGGKWNLMMDMKPRNLFVFQKAAVPEEVAYSNDPRITVWQEGDDAPLAPGSTIKFPTFIREADNSSFVWLFAYNKPDKVKWSFENLPEWLEVKEVETYQRDEKKLRFRIIWEKARSGMKSTGCTLVLGNDKYPVDITLLTTGLRASGFEFDRTIGFNAYNYRDSRGEGIKTVQGLGHSGNAVALPPISGGYDNPATPVLEYNFYTVSEGEATIKAMVIPTHPVNGGDVRIAIAFDDNPPVELSFATAFRSETWKLNVLRNQAVVHTKQMINKAGEHKIKVYALDKDVVLDQIMIDFEPERKFYEVPVNTSNELQQYMQ